MNLVTAPILVLIFVSGAAAQLTSSRRIHKCYAIATLFAGLGLMMVTTQYVALPVPWLRRFSWWHGPAFASALLPAATLASALLVVRWATFSFRAAVAFTAFLCAMYVLAHTGSNDYGPSAIIAIVEGASALVAATLGFVAGESMRRHSKGVRS